jgi:hypothetical protein
MSAVIAMDRRTFLMGFPAVQKNGNISYTLTYPPISIGPITLRGIGIDRSKNWLKTNKLVVESNCTTVVTSFPTGP